MYYTINEYVYVLFFNKQQEIFDRYQCDPISNATI